MLKVTEKALRKSIAHWERIVENGGEDLEERCALCDRYMPGRGHRVIGGCNTLDGCPVYNKTGEDSCGGSPYETWFYISDKLTWAEAELSFLKSLLPKGN